MSREFKRREVEATLRKLVHGKGFQFFDRTGFVH